ncbi:MAG: ribbon-helix-helix protein, CopG family [Spirochaetaceae bacterium]
MKTTVELSDALMNELKEYARRRETTMREVMETALRQYLAERDGTPGTYRLPDHTFTGNGVREGVEEGAWEQIRGMIYEGRGG